MNKRMHLLISGQVQGVYYRGSTVTAARELGLRGWVRNRRDGRVELEAEGDEVALLALLEWCRRGPALARVDQIEGNLLPCQQSLSDFTQAATV